MQPDVLYRIATRCFIYDHHISDVAPFDSVAHFPRRARSVCVCSHDRTHVQTACSPAASERHTIACNVRQYLKQSRLVAAPSRYALPCMSADGVATASRFTSFGLLTTVIIVGLVVVLLTLHNTSSWLATGSKGSAGASASSSLAYEAALTRERRRYRAALAAAEAKLRAQQAFLPSRPTKMKQIDNQGTLESKTTVQKTKTQMHHRSHVNLSAALAYTKKSGFLPVNRTAWQGQQKLHRRKRRGNHSSTSAHRSRPRHKSHVNLTAALAYAKQSGFLLGNRTALQRQQKLHPRQQHRNHSSTSEHTSKRNANGTASRLERTVAFYGAVDSRPYLFLLNVALQSVRRFHPSAGYFALLPSSSSGATGCEAATTGNGSAYATATGGATNGDALDPGPANTNGCAFLWRALLKSWSSDSVKPLMLPQRLETLFTPPTREERERDGAIGLDRIVYSRMTFLRHFVPQALLLHGYTYSVSLDPDTFCVRAWDFRILQRVELIGGRPVGSSARTTGWLQIKSKAAQRNMSGDESKIATSTANFTSVLMREMNVSASQLKRRSELNGGVLLFNNSACRQWRWGQTVAHYYARLRSVVEGDQDLVSFILTRETSFERFLMPTVYNYAFRRDRERLPYAVAHRLRHGMVGHFKSSGTRGELVMIHFVQDGKPWQPQQLGSYPSWLLATRLYHIRDWLHVARSLKPTLFSASVRLKAAERKLMGRSAQTVFRGGRKNEAAALSALVTPDAYRRCRCFVRSLAMDKMANATGKLAKKHQLVHGLPSASASGSVSASATREDDEAAALKRQRVANRQRKILLEMCCADLCEQPANPNCACSHSPTMPATEQRMCDAERGAAAQRFNCQLAEKRAKGDGWTPRNCSAPEQGAQGKLTLKHKSRIYYCRECATPANASRLSSISEEDDDARRRHS